MRFIKTQFVGYPEKNQNNDRNAKRQTSDIDDGINTVFPDIPPTDNKISENHN